jgi:uncharacterized membrane protein YfcA
MFHLFGLTISLGYVISGFIVGSLVGMTGVGGGSLMTPILILLFGVAPEKAVATDLIYASITKTGGSLVHALHRTIDWNIVARLATGSIPAAVATLLVFHYLGMDSAAVSAVVTKVLGVCLYLTAAALLARNWLLRRYTQRLEGMSEGATRSYTIGVGAVLGVLVTISSVGAGALGVTALILLYPRAPIVKIAASDIAHAVPLTLIAGVGHLLGGTINPALLVALLIGSLPGIMLSSALAPRLPDTALRIVLALTLIAAATKLLFP